MTILMPVVRSRGVRFNTNIGTELIGTLAPKRWLLRHGFSLKQTDYYVRRMEHMRVLLLAPGYDAALMRKDPVIVGRFKDLIEDEGDILFLLHHNLPHEDMVAFTEFITNPVLRGRAQVRWRMEEHNPDAAADEAQPSMEETKINEVPLGKPELCVLGMDPHHVATVRRNAELEAELRRALATLGEVHNWALLSTMGFTSSEIMANIGHIRSITAPKPSALAAPNHFDGHGGSID